MNPDQLEALLRASRPEPSARLRARVLAAAAMVERLPPWWARLRTWAAAAVVLFAFDVGLQEDGAPAPLPPTSPPLVMTPVDVEMDTLSPFARLAVASPPACDGDAPTQLSSLEEILR